MIGTPDGTLLYYRAESKTSPVEREIGRGEWDASTQTIKRNGEILGSSNGGNKVDFSAGEKVVVVTITSFDLFKYFPNRDVKPGGTILAFGWGQSNFVGFSQATTPMVANPFVFEMQTPDVNNPTTYSWQVADPNRVTNFDRTVPNYIIGLQGDGYANSFWAFCDRLQRVTGCIVHMVGGGRGGEPITGFMKDAPFEVSLSAVYAQALASPELADVDYPHIWYVSQGGTEAINDTSAIEYRDNFLAVKNNFETKFGGKGKAQWLLMESAAGFFPDFEGHKLVDQATANDLRCISTRGYSKVDAYHYAGDDDNRLGRDTADRYIAGLGTKDTPTTRQNNLNATVDPAGGDGIFRGYSRGSLWINTTTEKIFVCTNNNTGGGVARWKEITYIFSGIAADLDWDDDIVTPWMVSNYLATGVAFFLREMLFTEDVATAKDLDIGGDATVAGTLDVTGHANIAGVFNTNGVFLGIPIIRYDRIAAYFNGFTVLGGNMTASLPTSQPADPNVFWNDNGTVKISP